MKSKLAVEGERTIPPPPSLDYDLVPPRFAQSKKGRTKLKRDDDASRLCGCEMASWHTVGWHRAVADRLREEDDDAIEEW